MKGGLTQRQAYLYEQLYEVMTTHQLWASKDKLCLLSGFSKGQVDRACTHLRKRKMADFSRAIVVVENIRSVKTYWGAV